MQYHVEDHAQPELMRPRNEHRQRLLAAVGGVYVVVVVNVVARVGLARHELDGVEAKGGDTPQVGGDVLETGIGLVRPAVRKHRAAHLYLVYSRRPGPVRLRAGRTYSERAQGGTDPAPHLVPALVQRVQVDPGVTQRFAWRRVAGEVRREPKPHACSSRG